MLPHGQKGLLDSNSFVVHTAVKTLCMELHKQAEMPYRIQLKLSSNF